MRKRTTVFDPDGGDEAIAHPPIASEAYSVRTPRGEPAMASRKRFRRTLGAPHRRKRRYIVPLLENLENRLVLSHGIRPLVPPNMSSLAASGAASLLAPDNGLVPFPLAHGGSAWMLKPASAGPLAPGIPDSSHGATPTTPQPGTRPLPGVILGGSPGRLPLRRRPEPAVTRPRRLHPAADPDRLWAQYRNCL